MKMSCVQHFYMVQAQGVDFFGHTVYFKLQPIFIAEHISQFGTEAFLANHSFKVNKNNSIHPCKILACCFTPVRAHC